MIAASHSTPLIRVPITSLRPTQAAVGMRAVATKRQKVEKRARQRGRIDDYLGQRPIPSVLGPGGDLFMIDHHHLGLALWQAEVESAFVIVVEDLSVLPVAAFWRRMEADGRVYPFDGDGQRISPARLPRRLGGLRADAYRDLAWSVREAGGFHKTRAPYAEFVWADFLRPRISEQALRRDYDGAVVKAVKLCRSRQAGGLPGFVGR
jgi:hypothetical protein